MNPISVTWEVGQTVPGPEPQCFISGHVKLLRSELKLAEIAVGVDPNWRSN